MNLLNLFLCLYALLSLVLFLISFSRIKNAAFRENPWLNVIGAFVWVDVPVFSLLVTTIVVFYFLTNQSVYFLATAFCVFWSVRSYGEIIYWMHEQFAHPKRNNLETHPLYKFFQPDSLLVVFQTFWQAIFVLSILASLLYASKWLG